MRSSRHIPSPQELTKVVQQEISLTGIASRYGVSFTTAKRWVKRAGILDALSSPEKKDKRKQLVQRAPLKAKRLKIDQDLTHRLRDAGDRKLLARAIVDEFNLRYTFGRSGHRKRYILWLKIMMYDCAPVEQVAQLMGAKCKMRYRAAKSGVKVPYWSSEVNGYRAYKILELVRPFLVGQKAFQADLALRGGPLTDDKIPLGKWEYKKMLLSRIRIEMEKVPASRLPEPFRSSVTP